MDHFRINEVSILSSDAISQHGLAARRREVRVRYGRCKPGRKGGRGAKLNEVTIVN